MKNVTGKSILLFLIIDLALWGGCGYWIYHVITVHELPMWLLKVSFVIMCLAPFSSIIHGIFKLYWNGELDDVDKKQSETPSMKIYGSSN